MSWKNHVPKRDCDGMMRKVVQSEKYRPAFEKQVMIWLREDVKVTFQDHIKGDRWSMISVDKGAERCPSHFPYKEWQEFLAECILLGE